MKLRVTVHGMDYEVDVEVLDPGPGGYISALPPPVTPVASAPAAVPRPAPVQRPVAPLPGGSGSVAAPLAGVVKEVRVKAGDAVNPGDTLLVVEAMKMLTNISAPAAGKVSSVAVSVGDSVTEGQTLVEMS